jgi:DMSO/TMAO reductase YedYZ molybdopterin-dependent catalytic subunit
VSSRSTQLRRRSRAPSVRARLREPPPGPFRPSYWRSPLRGPWLTSFLGTLLGPLIVVIAATGLISHDAYYPELGNNATIDPSRDIGVLFHLPPSGPSWGYALTQGLHVTVGLATVPVLLAKLWSVIPRLFAWPAVRSVAQALERGSLLLLVGGGLFEFATGILNIQNYYPWHFGFVRAHYYGAWVFFTAFTLHVAVKLPVVACAYRDRGWLRPLRDDLKRTRPEPVVPNGLAPVAPANPTLSRRGLLAIVGGASMTLVLLNVGETIGGPWRRLALLAPRGRAFGSGPNDFQVNRTAAAVGVNAAMTGPSWRLLLGSRSVSLSLTRERLLEMPQHTYELTLGCVEGWSTTQRWTGVRLADLAALVAAPAGSILHVESIQPSGPFRHATLSAAQLREPRALLALAVNGAELSLDHGYPARLIVPAQPGVHCTKWVGRMSFEAA